MPGTGAGAGAGTLALILRRPLGHGGGSLNFLDFIFSGVTLRQLRVKAVKAETVASWAERQSGPLW